MKTHIETIKCPNCGHIQEATAEMTKPFATYIHTCVKCSYIITESEWEKVSKQKIDKTEFCECNSGFKLKNFDKCAICGGKWKGRNIK